MKTIVSEAKEITNIEPSETGLTTTSRKHTVLTIICNEKDDVEKVLLALSGIKQAEVKKR